MAACCQPILKDIQMRGWVRRGDASQNKPQPQSLGFDRLSKLLLLISRRYHQTCASSLHKSEAGLPAEKSETRLHK
jgi:hypothetical protein